MKACDSLSHPLNRLSTRMKLSKDPSLAAIIIETLRRHVPSRLYMRLDDLHKLTDDCVEVILHECPFLARPEDDDGLPIIREDRHNPKLQLTLQKKVIPEYNLVFATNSNPPQTDSTISQFITTLSDSSRHSHQQKALQPHPEPQPMNQNTQTPLVIFPIWLSVLSNPLHKTQDFTHSATSQRNGAGLFSPVHTSNTRSPTHLSRSSPLHSSHTKPSHKSLTIPHGILRCGGLPEAFQMMQLCPSCGST